MMKRLFALLVAVMMLFPTALPIHADSGYNDTIIDWSEHTTHVYDGCVDHSCNICGALRQADHIYDNDCDPDCSYCGYVRNVPGHVYDSVCDAACNSCGALRIAPHKYVSCSSAFCSLCGEERVAGHTYDSSTDPDCNVCGYTRGIVTLITQPSSVCVAEGAEATVSFIAAGDGLTYTWYFKNKNASAFTKSTSSTSNTYSMEMNDTRNGRQIYCVISDQYGNSVQTQTVTLHMLPHAYNEVITQAPGCTTPGVKTYTCSVCGDRTTASIDPQGHVYDNACDAICDNCGTTRTVGDHIYDNACDATCNECDALRQVPDHVYDNDDDTNCNVCGFYRNTCNHQYDNACDTTCNVCNATRDPQHDYADATCTAPQTCTVCGATEGDKLAHTYKTVTVKATTTANGYSVKECSVCKAQTDKKTYYKVSSITLSKTSYTYNGKVQKPTVTVKNSAGTNLTEGTSYTVKYSAESKAAGTYKVTITLKGNYSGTKTLSYTIKPQDVSKCTVTLSKTSYSYDGAVKKPTVTVKNAAGTKLTEGGSYTVTYASGRKAVGTYKVTIEMKGNYTGTVTKTFKIAPQDVSKCKISLSATSYTYNGAVKKPTVTVKNAAGTKLSTASYTVTYASGRKNVGTYKVTIKMKGNYTGTKTLTFKINPAKTSISSVTAGSKKLTVKWAKKTTQVTGYQIQYSTSKSFSSVKTKTISKNSTTSAALTGLKAKTTYYIRVRTYKTVNGVKYYSGWTTVTSAKTK